MNTKLKDGREIAFSETGKIMCFAVSSSGTPCNLVHGHEGAHAGITKDMNDEGEEEWMPYEEWEEF